MRILVLTNLFPPHYLGGYELICQTVVEALRERGYEIPILTSDLQVEAANGQPELPGIERLLRINGLYGQPWRGLRELRPIERHNNETLCAAIQRHQPDLVYVWNMGGLSKSMLHTLQALGLPTVFYLSDHWIIRGLVSDVWLRWWNQPHPAWPQRFIRALCSWTGARRHWDRIAPTLPIQQLRFQRIYFCSRALRQLTAQAGYDVGHGQVIYCPVHPRYFGPEPGAPRPRVQRLLVVGRLAEDKGVLTALRALARLRDRLDLELNLYGRGDADYVARLKSFGEQHQLRVNFRTAGLAEMPQVYRDHDLLLFTSEWAEPFALTPIEAMACGLPVIGTTTGGSAELFRPRENGLTYTAGDAEELAERVVEFAGDYTLRARCVQTAYREACARYAAPVIVDQVESYLCESVRTWPSPTGVPSHPSKTAACVPCVS